MISKTLFAAASAALALGLAGAATTASAQPSDEMTVTVSYGDLNMHSEAGARIALARIHQAAGKICGVAPTDPLDRMRLYVPCVQKITDRTVATLHNPVLAAVNSGAPVTPEATLASAR
jgi:UrcA family protein